LAVAKEIGMGKIYAGFGLALIVLSLCAWWSYEAVAGVVDNEVQARQAPPEQLNKAKQTKLIVLLSSSLALLLTSLSLILINRYMSEREEAEVRLALAHSSLEARVKERTAELGRANTELQRTHADLEVRVRQRTNDLGRANDDLRRTTMLQQAILNSANYSIISTDADGLIQTFNAAAQRWLGYSQQELAGRETPALFHDAGELATRQGEISREMGMPLDGGFEILVTRARCGETEEREWTYVSKNGRRFPVLLSVTALYDQSGEITGFLITGSDITERKEAEKELHRAKAAAEEANRTKSEFLANMSHELRTPLNSVIGFTNLLLKNKAGNLREQDLTFLERVLDNGKHLLKLINEVLDLAKVEAGRMQLELATVHLDELVRSTLASLEGHLKGKDVRLIPELPAQIAPLETDPGKLKQVLINLVGNAIKFTEHGTVTVRVDVDPADGRPLALDVIDTGVGMPADKLHDIFKAFHQVDTSTTRQYGGTGLGLTIAKSLCELMGYEIEVHSRVGAGSAFRVVLGEKGEEKVKQGSKERPAADPRPSLTEEIMLRAKEATGSADLRGKNVLVIDDDSDSRLLLTRYIEECGCRVVAVDCGDHGLRVGREIQPDLIVLDLMMPEMSGWDVLKALKVHPTLSAVPVIVVSIVARENRGSILGAVDLLDKPVSREALHSLLHRTLLSRKQRALVVDDSADSRHLVSAYLAEEGFETCEAANGEEALERLERFDADLVILDLVMPVMDGLSFLDSLRRDARHLRLPVVVVTAKDLTPQETERLGADGSAVVRKGVELADGLKRVVGEWLAQRRDG
jgi:PAS domain S-box-containing protein